MTRPDRIRIHAQTEGNKHYAGSTQVPVLGQSEKNVDDAVQDFGRNVDQYLDNGGAVAPDTGDFDLMHHYVSTKPNRTGKYVVTRDTLPSSDDDDDSDSAAVDHNDFYIPW